MEPNSVLQHTKEHCLMGIKGTVRRSTDGDFIHANVDLDIIISEEPEYGETQKPEEIFKIIEHFCLGRRRLHIFGNDHTVRPGWVTVGPDLTSSNYSSEQYHTYFSSAPEEFLVGSTETIEQLRPKSPPASKLKGQSGGSGRGRGRGDAGRGRGDAGRGRGDACRGRGDAGRGRGDIGRGRGEPDLNQGRGQNTVMIGPRGGSGPRPYLPKMGYSA